MQRLLKKEIKLVPAKVLNMRYCRILEAAEKTVARDIPVADAREILWIEDELRVRLITHIGHDFYPPDRVEEKPENKPEEKKLLRCDISHKREQLHATAPTPSQGKPQKPQPLLTKPKLGAKVRFNVVVTTSLGVKAAEFSVDTDTKMEADKLVNKEIRKLGLRGATYKIK